MRRSRGMMSIGSSDRAAYAIGREPKSTITEEISASSKRAGKDWMRPAGRFRNRWTIV